MRGETSIAELCRREGIAQNLYYRWSKDFLESGKKRLNGDTQREANVHRSPEAPQGELPAQGGSGRAVATKPHT